MLSASATERALASFITSDGTQIGKMLSSRLVVLAGTVLVPYFGELFLAESRAELDQCWPQTAMHVRNLALNQLANVPPTEFCLPGGGADFEQVLVSTASR